MKMDLSVRTPRWALADQGRFDPRAVQIADRHYNRQKVGTPQFVKPGSCIVLLTAACDALWVTSWQLPEHVKHDWPGAWECSYFRNESPMLSSDLIRDAVAVTRWHYGEPPKQGFVTFIDRAKTRPKRDPGYCYLMAGWKLVGRTKRGLYALHLAVEDMDQAAPPLNGRYGQMPLEAAA